LRRLLYLLLAAVVIGCATPARDADPLVAASEPVVADEDPGRWYLGGGGSLFPNVGVSGHVGWAFARGSAIWSLEAEGIWQFLDDEFFVDDGRPESGSWLQGRIGVRTVLSPHKTRRPVLRAGATWWEARGDEPNIVIRSGHYFGGYVGFGFEGSLSRTITAGPEITVSVASNDGSFSGGVVPQIGWRLSWWPGGHGLPSEPETGEVYGDLHFSVSPSIGGGLGLGQVFARGETLTWSAELLATFQPLSDGLLAGEGDGDFGQLRGSIKVVTAPDAKRHWTVRAGAVWMRNTAAVSLLPKPADHVGAFVGVGYEWDLGKHWTTGPELALMVVTPEDAIDVHVVPQFNWHLIYRF
jgi:hypothetical protein